MWVIRPRSSPPFIDQDGIISHIFPRVKVDGRVEQVLAALAGAPERASRARPRPT